MGRPQAIDGLSEELVEHEHELLHAPELIDLEAMNALRRLVRTGRVSERRGTQAAAALASTRLIRYPHAPLRERVWELRSELTAYDAAYLALAEAFADGLLVTADTALAARARASVGHDRVRLVR